MATLLSIATGNFNTASTWAVCNAASENDSVTSSTVLTTSYVGSTAFTPGAVPIDSIAVKVASRAASPIGTMSVELFNSTAGASVAGTEVTINVSDIDAGDTSGNGGCGWYVFTFASPVTPLAATNYTVRAKTSSATQVTLFSSSGNNWSRELRTTTTAAPAAGDNLFVAGQFTAAATSSSYTVTMDNTATTIFGKMTVNNKASLLYAEAASTNYYLKLGGNLDIYGGGTFGQGYSGHRLPASSTSVLEFNSASAAQFGIECRGGASYNTAGIAKTRITTLTADKAASATVIGVADTTGWLAGDTILFPATSRTPAETETKTILTVDSTTQITLTAGLTNAHGGSLITGVVGEAGNLSSNVKVRGVSSSNTAYLHFYPNAYANLDNTEFTNLGTISTGKLGIDVNQTTGQFICNSNAIYTGQTGWICINVTATGGSSGNISIVNNIGYTGYQSCFANVASTADQIWIGNLAVRSTTGNGFNLGDAGSTYTNNIGVANNASGFSLTESGGTMGTNSGNIGHSNTGSGISISSVTGTVGSLTAWRNGSSGLTPTLSQFPVKYSVATLFGNNAGGVTFSGQAGSSLNQFVNFFINAGTTLTQTSGIVISSGFSAELISFEDCQFGNSTTHSTGDLTITATPGIFGMQFVNCLFGSGTEISGQANLQPGYYFHGIGSTIHDQTAGSIKKWLKYGTINLDTTIFNTAAPSQRLTPNNASSKLISSPKVIPVVSGAGASVSVYIRKSVVGDGTAYNGNQPRLIVRRNYSIGINADTVLDTAALAAGNWEQLTGTTASVTADGAVEVFVDCDGTTGWVSVDDFTTSTSNDPQGMKFWYLGEPTLSVGGAGGGAGGSFTFS